MGIQKMHFCKKPKLIKFLVWKALFNTLENALKGATLQKLCKILREKTAF